MQSIGKCSVAGIMLGLGMVAYSRLVSNQEWHVSVLVPIAADLITAVTAFGGFVFFNEDRNVTKIVGIVLIVAGIVAMNISQKA